MTNSLDELVSVLDRLISRVDDLETRLSSLEGKRQPRPAEANVQNGGVPLGSPSAATARSFQAAAAAPARIPAAQPFETIFSRPAGNIAPVVGKAFLGIAGAYVLRALAESGSLATVVIAPVALAYAGMWLFWAARARNNVPFSTGAYAATSAFIFSPMLWELTVRFKVLPDTVTALLLVAFVVFAGSLARKRELTSLVWICAFSASLTSFVLLISTRDPAPFSIALIAMALATEASALGNLTFKVRTLIASALDIAVVSVIVIYTAEQGAPAEYRYIPMGLLLVIVSAPLLIYAGSTVIRSIVLRRGLSWFDIAQTVVAFALAWIGILRSTHNSAVLAVGLFCLAAAAGSYLAALNRFGHDSHREYHVFASFAAALLLAGSLLALREPALSPFLALAALCAIWGGMRWKHLSPIFHGVLFLMVSAVASGLLVFTAAALFDGLSAPLSWKLCFTALASLVCYASIWRMPGDEWQHRLVRLLLAVNSAVVLVAFSLLGLLLLIWHGVAPDSTRLAVLRTLVICAWALALAVVGSGRAKNELVWTAYGAVSLCTLKLLWEDMRTGSTAGIAASLFLNGLVWVLLPRIVRKSRSIVPE